MSNLAYGSITVTDIVDRGITGTEEWYKISSNSNETFPSGGTGWTKKTASTTIPVPTANQKYLWFYEITTYSDGTTSTWGPVVIGTYGETGVGIEYNRALLYLSTSNTTAPAKPTATVTQTGDVSGAWTQGVPTWSTGKYYWRCYETKYDRATNPYTWTDPVLDSALSTANENAATALSAANSANAYEQMIYIQAVSGTASVSAYPPSATTDSTKWISVSDESVTGTPPDAVTGQTPHWTLKRPTYQTNYPIIFVATQRRTVDGTITCTTPIKDDTITIIDGGHITTGSIDANLITTGILRAERIGLYGTMAVYTDSAMNTCGGMLGFTSGDYTPNTGDGIALYSSNLNSAVIASDNSVFLGYHNSTGADGSEIPLYVDGDGEEASQGDSGAYINTQKFWPSIIIGHENSEYPVGEEPIITIKSPQVVIDSEVTGPGLDSDRQLFKIDYGVNYNGTRQWGQIRAQGDPGYGIYGYAELSGGGENTGFLELGYRDPDTLAVADYETLSLAQLRKIKRAHYSSVSDLGLTSGSATILAAVKAMTDSSTLMCNASDFASSEVPSTIGVVVIRRQSGARWPVYFYGKTSGTADYRMYCESTSYNGNDANYPSGTWVKVSMAGHTHAAGDITSGTLPIARGGTGATTAAAARTALGITPANIGAASSGAVLWTNDSVSSGLGATTLSLSNMTNYNLYLILCRRNTSSPARFVAHFVYAYGTGNVASEITEAVVNTSSSGTGYIDVRSRTVTVNRGNNTVTFTTGNLNQSGGASSTNAPLILVPQRIVGFAI